MKTINNLESGSKASNHIVNYTYMSNSEEKGDKRKIAIRYKQGPNYQTYHADGAIGGWTPNSNLSLDFYVEKGPVPEVVIHEVVDDKTLGPVLDTKGEPGIRRERQLCVILSAKSAVELRDWLDKKIEDAEKAGLLKTVKKDD